MALDMYHRPSGTSGDSSSPWCTCPSGLVLEVPGGRYSASGKELLSALMNGNEIPTHCELSFFKEKRRKERS